MISTADPSKYGVQVAPECVHGELSVKIDQDFSRLAINLVLIAVDSVYATIFREVEEHAGGVATVTCQFIFDGHNRGRSIQCDRPTVRNGPR